MKFAWFNRCSKTFGFLFVIVSTLLGASFVQKFGIFGPTSHL